MTHRLFQHTGTSQVRKVVLMLVTLGVTLCRRYCPSFIRSTTVFTSFLYPLLWCSVIFMVLCFPRTRPVAKIREKSFILWMTAACSIVYVFIMMISGMVSGFGKSPYNHSLYGMALNIFQLFSALIAKELVRDYLVNGSGRNAKFGDRIFAAVFIYLLSFNPDQFVNLETNLQIIQFISIDMIAKLCISCFATYLVYIGGPTPSILYLGIHDGFFWFCPILPNLSWIAQAFIEILLPVSCLMLMRYSCSKRTGLLDREKDTENPLGWIMALVVSILIIWFTVGVFPVRPYVIITGSMIPVIYPGDIVLVKRDIDNLKTGDIIQYKSGDIYIFHRITEIVEKEKEKDTYLYITKGDNNSSEDPEPVGIDSIRGRVIYTVPKAGYLAMLLYQY